MYAKDTFVQVMLKELLVSMGFKKHIPGPYYFYQICIYMGEIIKPFSQIALRTYLFTSDAIDFEETSLSPATLVY